MIVDILTLFPDMIRPVVTQSILGRAQRSGILEIRLHDIREHTLDKHRRTDDYPFGGGAGMVMMAQPVVDAMQAVDPNRRARRIYLSPRGRTLTQRVVEELAKEEHLVLLCGHYEGIDQRALDSCIDEELSIGDYVLTGGELGAMVVVDAVARLLPGVLGSEDSAADESFSTGLLEYPQYTRPASFQGQEVPPVLLHGVHAQIVAWRREQSLALTRVRRPELLEEAPLSPEDRDVLTRLEAADHAMERLEKERIRVEREAFYVADAYPQRWLQHFAAGPDYKTAKKRCLSGKRHTGWLLRAFSEGYIPCLRGEEAVLAYKAKPQRGGCLYLPEERLLLRLAGGLFDPGAIPFRSFIWESEEEASTWGQDGSGEKCYYSQVDAPLERSISEQP